MTGEDKSREGLAVDARQPIVTPQIMSTPPTPTVTRRPRREDHDTGFPEPFGEKCNTTLPHPDADLSPNASISQDDLSIDGAMKRRRLTMLRKHRRTVSNASSVGASSTTQAIHSVLSIVSPFMPGSPDPDVSAGPGSDSSEPSKASGTFGRGGAGGDDETPPTSPSTMGDEKERRGSGGRLRKWMTRK